ncbi:MAG: restriction endonuclease subunit S [Candidatus Electrothrix sp. AX5]|nr:restriction endonuclease subunit S [Candidatus Electrothrix sp. AX5]
MQRFEKYSGYKDSGVDWIGEIPAGWEVKRLKSEIDLLTGYPFKSDSYTDEGIKLARGINVKEGVFSWKDLRCWPQVDKQLESYLLKNGDILIAMDGSKVGKNYCQVKKSDLPILLLQRVARLRVKDGLDSNYLFWNIANRNFLNWVNISKTDPMVPHIAPSDINGFVVAFPSLPEQTAIANFLDEKTTKIDTAIAQKKQMISLLKERKQVLIQNAVTKGIDPAAKMKDSGVDWIGEIPEHWEVKSLKYCTKIFRGKFTHRPRNDSRLYDGKYPFFQTGDVAKAGKFLSKYRQTLNDLGLRVSTLIPKGTIVITIAANIGDVAILDIDACFPDSIVGFAPMRILERNFFYNSLLVMKEQFMSSTIKNTQMNLNVDRIGTNSIAIPPLAEQTAIVDFIETESAKIDTSITLQQQQITKLKEYKTILIDHAVTGKIKVA